MQFQFANKITIAGMYATKVNGNRKREKHVHFPINNSVFTRLVHFLFTDSLSDETLVNKQISLFLQSRRLIALVSEK